MTTTTTEPTLDGVYCLVFDHLDPRGRPISCPERATVWRVEDDGVQWPVCERHRPPESKSKPESGKAITNREDQMLRREALDQAVRASSSYEEPSHLMGRAQAFYAFLSDEETTPPATVNLGGIHVHGASPVTADEAARLAKDAVL